MTIIPYYDPKSEKFVPPHLRDDEWYNKHEKELDKYTIEKFEIRSSNLPSPDNAESYFTVDNVLAILTSLYFGSDIDLALNARGIPKQVYIVWKQYAIDHEGLARRFMILEQIAKAEFEQLQLKQLGLMSSIDAKASYFLLERATNKASKYAPRNFVTVDSISADYMKELESLITSGAMTVEQLVNEIGSLDETQLKYLNGVEVMYRKAKKDKDSKRKQLTVKGYIDE